MEVWAPEDSVRFARSQEVCNRLMARALPDTSFLFLRLNSCRRTHSGQLQGHTRRHWLHGHRGSLQCCPQPASCSCAWTAASTHAVGSCKGTLAGTGCEGGPLQEHRGSLQCCPQPAEPRMPSASSCKGTLAGTGCEGGPLHEHRGSLQCCPKHCKLGLAGQVPDEHGASPEPCRPSNSWPDGSQLLSPCHKTLAAERGGCSPAASSTLAYFLHRSWFQGHSGGYSSSQSMLLWCFQLRKGGLRACTKWLTRRLSKSSPPRWVSPAVALTSKMPSSMVSRDTSKVPPPRSKMSTLRSPVLALFLSRPYAMAAAVGSLMMRMTSRPAMTPAAAEAVTLLCVMLGCAAGHLLAERACGTGETALKAAGWIEAWRGVQGCMQPNRCSGELPTTCSDCWCQKSRRTCILGCLALWVIEVGRHSDHCALDLLGSTQESLCSLLHLDEHHAADLLCWEGLVLPLVVDCIEPRVSAADTDRQACQ